MMKVVLALGILAVFATVSEQYTIKASPRANLDEGYIVPGDVLLYSSYVYQPAITNAVLNEDVVYSGNTTNRITAVQAIEVGRPQWANAFIVWGGIGRNNVTVRFVSARGLGYNYLLNIWGV